MSSSAWPHAAATRFAAAPLAQAEQAAYEEQLRQRQQQAAGSSASSAAGNSAADAYGSGSGGRTVEYGSTAAVPEVVTDRMLKRVILFMGTPVFGGVLLFPRFYDLKVRWWTIVD